MMMDKKEGENIINENIIDDSKNEKKQFPEDINEQKPDDKNEINYKEEEEENKDNFEYIKSEFEKSKRNSLIKRKSKQKLSFYNKKSNFLTKKEEKIMKVKIIMKIIKKIMNMKIIITVR